jgi:hypothetical protein
LIEEALSTFSPAEAGERVEFKESNGMCRSFSFIRYESYGMFPSASCIGDGLISGRNRQIFFDRDRTDHLFKKKESDFFYLIKKFIFEKVIEPKVLPEKETFFEPDFLRNMDLKMYTRI